MKWFQHMTDAHDDEFLKELMHKFGSDGYTAWFITAELVAKIVKVLPTTILPGKPPPKEPYKVHARLEAVPHVFIDATKIPPDRLEKVYEFCARRKKFRFTRTKERWVIDWPKVLEFKDNTTSDLIAKYSKLLGSSLEAPSASPFGAPIGIGTTEVSSLKEGVQGEVRDDEMAIWFRRIMGNWLKMCPAPGERSQRNHIKDWVRQGVSRRAIEEAPMLPKYQKMDFYKIGEELKREVNGHGNNGRGGAAPINPGAKEVIGHFALKPGELDAKIQQRIADRERREGQGQGNASVEGRGNGGVGSQSDEVPGAEKV